MEDTNKEDGNERAEETAERWLTYIVGVSAAASFTSMIAASIFVMFEDVAAGIGFALMGFTFFVAFLIAGNAKAMRS